MALDITVQISTAAVAGKVGFGVPLVLVSKATKAIPYTECATLKEVETLCGKDTDAYKIAQLMWAQANAPTKIAFYASTGTATAAIAEVVNENWRQLIVVFGEGDTDDAAAVATYIEATKDKMYFVTVTDIGDFADVKGKDRTVAFYYNAKAKDEDGKETEEFAQPYAVAALVGETAGRTAGSFTYKNLIIKGLEPLDLTDDVIGQIHTAGGITLLLKAGDIVTSEGMNTNGEFIDVIDSKDWIIQQIAYQGQKLFNNVDKLGYDDAGISGLQSVVYNVLQEAFNNKMIAADEDNVTPLFSVNFKRRAEMSAADRKSRIYTGGFFSFVLAGAIHTAEVNGELVI